MLIWELHRRIGIGRRAKRHTLHCRETSDGVQSPATPRACPPGGCVSESLCVPCEVVCAAVRGVVCAEPVRAAVERGVYDGHCCGEAHGRGRE